MQLAHTALANPELGFLSQILFWIYFFLNYNQNIQTGYEILTTTRFVFVSITTKKLLFLFFCQGFWLNKACISLNIVQEVGKEITCAQAHIETSYSQQSQFWITQPYYGMTSSPIAFRSYFYCRKAVITFQLKLCLLVEPYTYKLKALIQVFLKFFPRKF